MKRFKSRVWLLFLVILFTMVIAACGSQTMGEKPHIEKKSAAVVTSPFAVLQAESDKFLKMNRPLYIQPQEVLSKVITGGDTGYVLVDIRSDEHYANAHIPGSLHISYADVWRDQKISYLPKDQKIIVIDYSGHTASQVAAFWSMLGYDAIAMKNGMAGWSKNRDVIGGTPILCEPQNYPVVAGTTTPGTYDVPKLETKAVSPADLLMKRSQEATETPPVIQPKDLKDKMGSYYIVDLRQSMHYQDGHVEGAVNISFRSLAEIDNLKKLPPDKNIVLICYDGHASSQAARILNQLGYHATALKDGMSAWVSDEKLSGVKPIACNISEKPVAILNAVLKPGPSTAAT